MYYITGAAADLTLFEITSCLTHETKIITEKQLDTYEVFNSQNKNEYFSCTEVPDEGELDILHEEYTNGVKHTEEGRYFLFIPITEVKTIAKPQYVIVRRKGDGTGPWKLYMLKKTDRGVTRIEGQAYVTDDKGDAMRKVNSINDYYAKNKWPAPGYMVMELNEALIKIKEDEQYNRF